MARRRSRRGKKINWSQVLIPALAVGVTAAVLIYLQRRNVATATSYAMGTSPKGIIDPIFIVDPTFRAGSAKIVDPNFLRGGKMIIDPIFGKK